MDAQADEFCVVEPLALIEECSVVNKAGVNEAIESLKLGKSKSVEHLPFFESNHCSTPTIIFNSRTCESWFRSLKRKYLSSLCTKDLVTMQRCTTFLPRSRLYSLFPTFLTRSSAQVVARHLDSGWSDRNFGTQLQALVFPQASNDDPTMASYSQR